MNKQHRIAGSLYLSTTLIALSCTTAYAVSFNSFDPRSMAMGGAGVAVANVATAPFFNPALLNATHDDDFAIELPIIGVRVHDSDNFVGSMNDFQDNSAILDSDDNFVIDSRINSVNSSIQALNWAQAETELRLIADDARELSKGLSTLSDKAIGAEAGAAIVAGIPSKNLGIALSISGWGAGGGIAHYRDAETLHGLADDMDAYAACIDAPGGCDLNALSLEYVTVANGEVTFDTETNVSSTVDIRAIQVTEFALSFAKTFTLSGKEFSAGITPKYRKIQVFDYRADVNTADEDDFDAADHTEEYDNFNLDLGIAKEYGNGWRTGFVVKNIIPVTFETRLGNDIELSPQARIGLSHQKKWMTAAFDLDLTRNEAVSFEHDTQFASFGIELNAANWAQIRAGYRANLAESAGSVASVGLGLSPFGVHIDLAVAGSDDELGASMQLGFRF